MSRYLKKINDAESLANGLKALGWNPTVSTILLNGEKKMFSVGVTVPVGDDRLKWAPHQRDPAADFFSIANIAKAENNTMTMKPIGFEWSRAGLDSVHLSPSKDESVGEFVSKLKKITPNQLDLFGGLLENPVLSKKDSNNNEARRNFRP